MKSVGDPSRRTGSTAVAPAAPNCLRTEDVPAVAALHMRAFETFFLARLGERFLRQFYAGFAEDPGAVTVIARADDGRVVGAVVGNLAPDQFFRRLLRRRGLRLALASLPAVLRDPRVAARTARAVTYRGETTVARAEGALLSSICVDPEVEGSGYGRWLIDQWWCRARERGARSAYLTTDADGNDRVNDFYRRAGWTLLGSQVVAEGRRVNCYGVWADGRSSPGTGPEKPACQ